MIINRVKDLYGYNQRHIEATYWQAKDEPSEKVGIVLPGYLYPSDGPATFYLKLLFMKYNWDYLTIDYRYNENEEFLQSDDEAKKAYFEKEQGRIAQYIIDTYRQKTVCLIGKSIGTTAIHTMCTDTELLEAVENISFILLTPTEVQSELVKAVSGAKKNLLFFIGNKDQYYDEKVIHEVHKKRNIEYQIVPNAGHLFEDKDNDTGQSIENIKSITAFVEEHLSQGFLG